MDKSHSITFNITRLIKAFSSVLILLLISGCDYEPSPNYCDFPDGSTAYCAVKPIYMTFPESIEEGPVYVSLENATEETQVLIDQGYPIKEFIEFNNAGKIYTIDNLLLVNDRYKGVYLFDNSDPIEPKQLIFFEAFGATDMVVNNGYVYINNFSTLLSFELANPSNWSKTEDVLNYYFDENSLPFQIRFAEIKINISEQTRTETPIEIDEKQGLLIGYLNSDGKEFYFSDSAL